MYKQSELITIADSIKFPKARMGKELEIKDNILFSIPRVGSCVFVPRSSLIILLNELVIKGLDLMRLMQNYNK